MVTIDGFTIEMMLTHDLDDAEVDLDDPYLLGVGEDKPKRPVGRPPKPPKMLDGGNYKPKTGRKSKVQDRGTHGNPIIDWKESLNNTHKYANVLVIDNTVETPKVSNTCATVKQLKKFKHPGGLHAYIAGWTYNEMTKP